MNKWLHGLTVLVLTGFVLVLSVFFYSHYLFTKPNVSLTQDQLFIVEKGSSLNRNIQLLSDQNLIEFPLLFKIAGRLSRVDRSIKAGEYKIPALSSMQDILTLFKKGEVFARALTIPEGLTVHQIMEIINQAEALGGEIKTTPKEGTLMPDTYFYTNGETKQDVINRMQQAMQEALNTLWENKTKTLPFKTPQDAVILASIVEKETGIAAEREKVAGVFINRLEKGMLLQSDPTIIYPLSKKKGKLHRPLYRTDWKYDSPYNTYMYAGLPPSPIANPGRKSLYAVFNPEKHDFIYFVADGTGGHVFAKTLKGHNNNVAKWRKIKKERGIE